MVILFEEIEIYLFIFYFLIFHMVNIESHLFFMIPLMKLLMHCLNQKTLEFLLTCDNLPLPLISKFRVYFYPCVGVKVHKVSGVNIRIRYGSRSFRKEGASLPSLRNGPINQIKQWNSTLTHLM